MIKIFRIIITIINLICIFLLMTATIASSDERLSNRGRQILDISTIILIFNSFAIWWR